VDAKRREYHSVVAGNCSFAAHENTTMSPGPKLGATYLGDGKCSFLVWAPLVRTVEVHVVAPQERSVPLEKVERGYHHGVVDLMEVGSLYFYTLDGKLERPDPASRSQPRGVIGPSEVVNPSFSWHDDQWRGRPLEEYVIYEIHVGAYTEEGTFDAAISHLDRLRGLGVTAIELMPVAQFPGDRNWGYDGVYPFAVQSSYGGPEGLKRLADACHQRGMAVILDVVYNHFGPEGNFIADFGPYFTDRYLTPWGDAINFDGPGSDEVRRFFVENALFWVVEHHVDALRLDSVHAIIDRSPEPFLAELAAEIHEQAERLGRDVYLIGESAANDVRHITPRELGGYGLDAQWNDDFHHSLHVLLTGEREGYYQDFGSLDHLAKAFEQGFVYSGEYSSFRGQHHGTSSAHVPAQVFVVFAQNHDQVGNRMRGERLFELASFEALKLAAGIVLLSPFVPLLFMGEEYGETAPFLYFVSHSDPGLVEAVRQGRRQEFAAFQWKGDPPDPQDEATFLRSKLEHQLRNEGHHRVLLDFHKELIRLRKETPSLNRMSKDTMQVSACHDANAMLVRRWSDGETTAAIFCFGREQVGVSFSLPAGSWHKVLDSAEEQWLGPGTSIPQNVTSGGEVRLSMHPEMFVLLACRQEA
jgi:maltooligosyltrehalose trehalohydrolase